MEEDKLFSFFNELGMDFLFQDLSEYPKQCFYIFNEVKDNIDNTEQLRNSNFNALKDAVIKHREETDIRFCKEEDLLLKKISGLNSDTDTLKENLDSIKNKIKAIEMDLKDAKVQSEELENQRKHVISEKSKVVDNLDRIRAAYRMAVLLYQKNLGMALANYHENENFVVTFLSTVSQLQNLSIEISKLNGSYVINDGNKTNLQFRTDLMAYLWKERKNWLLNKLN